MTLDTDKGASQQLHAILCQALSTYSEDEIYLDETPSWLFGEKRVIDIYVKFRKKLCEVENEIKERNKALEILYTILQPSKIPADIAI